MGMGMQPKHPPPFARCPLRLLTQRMAMASDGATGLPY